MPNDVLASIKKELDARYELSRELLVHLGKALEAYERPKDALDIPRCSRTHLALIVKEVSEYAAEIHRVRCELPRLLTNQDNRD